MLNVFQNKTRYTVLVLSADNLQESEVLQKLIGRYQFKWCGHEIGYFNELSDNFHTMYLILGNSEILWNSFLDTSYLTLHTWNGKVYTVKDFVNLKCLLQYGQESPSYEPRKLDRTL